ncbi:UNVERIFIED_CONTAM: hypothetical protein GTU68_042083 [Idotea baltica]|nr:hypothetical protein [Idotea baltica]
MTQDGTTICGSGIYKVNQDNEPRDIRIHHIHLEEDAGKSIHDLKEKHSVIDLNRAGTALCEIVTEPDFRKSTEAHQFLTELRELVQFLGICDGNMEEGSMRCDANISIRAHGQIEYGNKVEIKNMNSIRNVKRAIEFEYLRQCKMLEARDTILVQTRGFDAANGSTFAQRSKEMAHDYRYFPEPDLPSYTVSDAEIAELKSLLPELPKALRLRLVQDYQLKEYDANILSESAELARYFEDMVKAGASAAPSANWIVNVLKGALNEANIDIASFNLSAIKMAEIVKLIEANKIQMQNAKQDLLPAAMSEVDKSVHDLAKKLNIFASESNDDLTLWINEAIQKHPEKAKALKNGKKNLVGLFMGEIMKASKGKVNPKEAQKILMEKVNTL